MTTLGGNLRTFLLEDPAISAVVGDKVFQNKVPTLDERSEWPDAPYIWFMRSGTEPIPCLDQIPGTQPYREYFDLECCSPEVGQEIELAELIWQRLSYYRGQFGDTWMMAVIVNDHSEQYLYRNNEADEGLSIAALTLELIPGRN